MLWNRAAERLYGWSEAEALGAPLGELIGCEVDPVVDAMVLEAGGWEGPLTLRHRVRPQEI